MRELVDFVLRRGDLGGERDFVGSSRALAGTRGHQQIQRSRPQGYQSEIPVEHELETAGFSLRIRGRIDGLFPADSGLPLLEEIKTVQGSWDRQPDPLHWAQAKVYAYIHSQAQGLDRIAIQLTYLHLETGEITEFREAFSIAQLSQFFAETTAFYLEWLREYHEWRLTRDQSIRALPFPFSDYRPGQRALAVAAYRVLAASGRLFIEAPTGTGKTISVLFPAIKALAEGKLERIFYLTARTVGRAVAQKACADLRQAGLRLRSLTLTAKEKVCVRDGHPCDPNTCPLTRWYYDRRHPAMRAALGREEITREVLAAVGEEFQVCPFELSLDVSSWVDAVICDYNYVFDPTAYLRRHFAEDGGDFGFLIDEAHNLVDRAREMYSADLDGLEIQQISRAVKKAFPRCARALTKLSSELRKLSRTTESPDEPAKVAEPAAELNLFQSQAAAPESTGPSNIAMFRGTGNGFIRSPRPAIKRGEGQGEGFPAGPGLSASFTEELAPMDQRREGVNVSRELPASLLPLLDSALKEAETWLVRNEPADFREGFLQLYFRLHAFRRTAEDYNDHFVTIIKSEPSPVLRLFCLDPSALLRQALARGKAAIFFSATLTPLDYYRTLLGGEPEDGTLRLPSPFPPEHLAVLIQDRIPTHYKARAGSLVEVVEAIASLIQGRRGNYLVYLPSHQYLRIVHDEFQIRHPEITTLLQRPAMTESERDNFLAAFAVEHGQTLAGFAVLGGMFGEGIDLVGDALIGVVIVGVGLPQLCVERDLIRDYFQERTGAGFDYAYTFPGMNRVLQAIGRVIRSETDRGVALLIDARFIESRYRRLFPAWWRPVRVGSEPEIRHALSGFWGAGSG